MGKTSIFGHFGLKGNFGQFLAKMDETRFLKSAWKIFVYFSVQTNSNVKKVMLKGFKEKTLRTNKRMNGQTNNQTGEIKRGLN